MWCNALSFEAIPDSFIDCLGDSQRLFFVNLTSPRLSQAQAAVNAFQITHAASHKGYILELDSTMESRANAVGFRQKNAVGLANKNPARA